MICVCSIQYVFQIKLLKERPPPLQGSEVAQGSEVTTAAVEEEMKSLKSQVGLGRGGGAGGVEDHSGGGRGGGERKGDYRRGRGEG